MTDRLQCEFLLVRYVPDPVKNEFVNIGVLLRETARPERRLVRFTKDWARVRCVDPDADIDDAGGDGNGDAAAAARTRSRTVRR